MCLGIVRFQLQCSSHVFDGNLGLAHRGSNHAEKMERIRVIRFNLQDLPIDLLGSLEPAALMVLYRNRQCFGNCGQFNLASETTSAAATRPLARSFRRFSSRLSQWQGRSQLPPQALSAARAALVRSPVALAAASATVTRICA